VKALLPTLCATTLALCAAASAPARADGSAPHTVNAPHYGDTLFHFFQDRYFSGITGLMVSQHFGRVAPHDDEAEVLRGGMLLSFGMHPQATEVFERLIEHKAAPAVQDRAWFFLARIRHQRGLLAQAQDALARIAAPLTGSLEEDRQLLLAQVLMDQQDFAGAATVLDSFKGMKGSTDASQFARFNLGVAWVKTGQAERGIALLEAVGQAPAANEVQRSLRDRANVALGFVALQGKKPLEARAALQRVRLASTQANKALLGFGWAATELNDPQLAIAPWAELVRRPVQDAAVLEAHIALPYAMSEIGAYSRALVGYEHAVTVFEQERSALQGAMSAIHSGALVQSLLAHNPGEAGLGAQARIEELPELPYAAQLAPLLAGHEFQENTRHLRDLQFVAANLAQWQASLGSFEDMLANRRAAFEQRLPAVRQASGAVDLPALQQRRDTLAAEWLAAETSQDPAAFADSRELTLQARLTRAQAALKSTLKAALETAPAAAPQTEDTSPDASDNADRLRRVQGALLWQQAQQLPARAWRVKKALRDTDQALANARERDAALLQAQQEEPARHARFAARIGALQARLQALLPQVALLDTAARQQLQHIAVTELQGQQERLDVYAAQARLAMAQIQDRSQVAQRATPARPTGNGARP
jgi:hypothetical protein